MSAPRIGVLIVGAGLAAFHTAAALRRAGYAGSIRVIGEEPHRPYDRPPLSKAFLAGTVSTEDLQLDDPFDPLDVDWDLGSPVVGLETASMSVHTRDGRVHRAETIVLATGSTPRRLGHMPHGTHVLHTIEHALALRESSCAGSRVVIVGGGFIGLEAAAMAVACGAAEVTVAASDPLPLAGRLGFEVATALRSVHERAGVRFAPPSRVVELLADTGGRLSGVRRSDGGVIPAELAICGLGADPATGWLRGTGLGFDPASGAILCDESGRTAVPGILAAGDCAAWAVPGVGVSPARHWQDAVDHAGVIATSLMGSAPPPLPVPYFWSEQHHVRLQGAGIVDGRATARILDGTVEDANLLVSYERDGHEIGVLGMNRPREVTRWRRTRAPRPAASAAA